ncbi:MAG: flagellar M-ring protein FliF [Kofleriaceae bacterium]|nr:flagellar M-ring protein FliF [Kofleriaceae bacterium]
MPEPTSQPTNPLLAIASQARALWQRLPSRARLGAIATVVGIVGVIAFLALRPGPGPWRPVAERLTPADASELSSVLAERGIEHRVGRNGTTVEVPAALVAQALAAARAANVPHGGVGFELFDGTKLGRSDFVEKVDLRRALQGELARTIATLAPVEAARVMIAPGTVSVFKDVAKPATASVTVRLRPGQSLAAAQVQGIKNLVAAAIDGLEAERVVVVDQRGSMLDADDQDHSDDAAQIEQGLAAQVRALLERVLGVGKVEVVVRADVDRSKITRSEELYDPAATALRSSSELLDAASAAANTATAPSTSGVAGVQANLPGGPAATAGPGGPTAPTAGTIQATKNYEVSRKVNTIEEAPVRIKKLQVAVLVDYRAVDGGDPEPLTAAELKEYTSIVHAAAGLDDARGDQLEIRSVPFAIEPEPKLAPTPIAKLPVPLPALLGGLAALVAVAVVVMTMRRRRKAAVAAAAPTLALPASLAEVERALDAPTDGTVPALPAAGPEGSIEERVLAAVKTDPARAARVLASWLSEPDASAATAKGGKAA